MGTLGFDDVELGMHGNATEAAVPRDNGLDRSARGGLMTMQDDQLKSCEAV